VAIVFGHPPLKGEGRIAEGDPGWGGGRVADDGDAVRAAPPSPPPGPLARADLPPPGGGGCNWQHLYAGSTAKCQEAEQQQSL